MILINVSMVSGFVWHVTEPFHEGMKLWVEERFNEKEKEERKQQQDLAKLVNRLENRVISLNGQMKSLTEALGRFEAYYFRQRPLNLPSPPSESNPFID